MDVESFLLLCRHDFSPPKIPGCAPLGSALGFFKRSLIEAKRAGSGAYPGTIFILSKTLGTHRLGARLDSQADSLTEDEHGGIDAYPMKWGA